MARRRIKRDSKGRFVRIKKVAKKRSTRRRRR